jgi:hypothetical protein
MVTCLLLPLPLPLALLTSPSPYSEVYIHQSIWPQHTFNESSLLGLGFGPSSLEWFGEVLEMTTSSSLSSCGHPWTRVVMVGPSYDGSCHLALTFGFSFMGGSQGCYGRVVPGSSPLWQSHLACGPARCINVHYSSRETSRDQVVVCVACAWTNPMTP